MRVKAIDGSSFRASAKLEGHHVNTHGTGVGSGVKALGKVKSVCAVRLCVL